MKLNGSRLFNELNEGGSMRKTLLLCTVLAFLASLADAANFQPNVLKLSAPAKLLYQFNGNQLDIPFTITGTPAGVMLCVYTSGKAASIKKVTNGYLGWHYMNGVDTSLYVSSLGNYGIGTDNHISWSGKDKAGSAVPAGNYTYYLWAFDNKDARVSVCAYIKQLAGAGGAQGHIQETGPDGKALTKPIFLGWNGLTRWTIGNDPLDKTLFETTSYTLGSGYSSCKVIALQSDNFSNYFLEVGNTTAKIKGVRKMKYVPNGESEFVTTWGDNGMCSWSGTLDADGGCISNGDVIYTVDNAYHGYNGNVPLSDFYFIDANEGSVIKKINMTNWWSSLNDYNAGAQINGGPNGYDIRNGYLFLNSHSSCLKQMVDPGAETTDAFFMWSNKNGDYLFDKNWEPESKYKWACNDYRAEPETYHFSADHNLFSTGSVFDLGAVSFGLIGPDGTGMGYFSFAGELSLGALGAGRWHITVDSNSAYDGFYSDNYAAADTSMQGGIWYVAQNSFKGVISNQTSVMADSPAMFTVAQNTPNPFNPATTISFTLSKSEKVTVEIFNAAGQKVDTVANAIMSAGSHSVVWNAQRHSAGAYFYSVRAGNTTKTMKMTLIK